MANVGSREPAWNDLPGEIIQVLGLCLDAHSWAACRATCSSWRGNITSSIRVLEIDMERDAHRWMMVLTCVARIFPSLTSVVLLVSNRITPQIFAERLASLAITSTKLQELEIRFIYLPNPTLGAWLEDLSGITELRSLKALRLAGGACPPPSFFASLSCLRRLSVLEFLPGVYGQMSGFDAPDAGSFSDSGVGDAHLAAIGALTQLRHLTVKVAPADTSPDGLADLAAHGLLPLLQQLSLYDSELPAQALAATLAPAAVTALTQLQVGLSNVDDLSALGRLPKLQGLSLDTVALSDLRELVLAAARANIPATGPGSITGLCLLDQAVSSPLELAALSQLSSLQELVLVNPTMELPASNEQQQQQPAAAAAPTAADNQHLQSQRQSMPMDMAVFAGLSNLKLLQIDLLHRDSLHHAQGPAAAAAAAAAGAQHPGNPVQVAAVEGLALPPAAAVAAAAAGFAVNPHLLQPLRLVFTADSVRQLSEAWTEVVTLDLSGFGPDLLPESAVTGFSNLRSLKFLSLTSSDRLALHQYQELAGAGEQERQQLPQLRKLPWWHLPRGLSSLCLTHFDLSGSSSSSSAASSSPGSSSPAGDDQQRCRSSCCCLSALQQQQQQGSGAKSFAQGLSRVQQLLTPRGSPLHHKRRRQSQSQSQQQSQQQQQEVSDVAPDQELGEADAAAAACGKSGSGSGAAAGDAAGSTACTCAARLARHFSGLQALWLEQCVLPPHMLPACLPPAAAALESLALLQVAGTVPADLAVLSCLTTLSSLRLVPADHSLDGLQLLTGLHHLKKLSVRLTHLLPSDLSVLSQLRSLFCLSLSAPLSDGQLLPGFPSAVRISSLVDLVAASLPYCDLELVGEPNLNALAGLG